MLKRLPELECLRALLKRNPVAGIIGARQVGKTTLAHMYAKSISQKIHFFDLENTEHLARLSDPMLTLKQLKGLIVIDEVQRHPEIFSTIRVLVDRPKKVARFLILGSASPVLLQQSSESLAGRIEYHQLGGFTLNDAGNKKSDQLWIRGGFPRSYLARTIKDSDQWRSGFINIFLERDLLQLGINIKTTTLRRFWSMLAHYHAQIWNSSEFARAFGVADTTIRNYLDVLTDALVLFQLQPWHENISKRQVKSPKVYIADSGLLHTLLNLKTRADLEGHPKIGASWEGFCIDQIIRHMKARAEERYFWATHSGAELDLFITSGRKRLGFEIKRTSSPKLTPSMRIALADLKLTKLYVVHAGDESFPLANQIEAMPLISLLQVLKPLR